MVDSSGTQWPVECSQCQTDIFISLCEGGKGAAMTNDDEGCGELVKWWCYYSRSIGSVTMVDLDSDYNSKH